MSELIVFVGPSLAFLFSYVISYSIINKSIIRWETMAKWIRLRFPFGGPRFEFQAKHLPPFCFSHILCYVVEKRTKIEKPFVLYHELGLELTAFPKRQTNITIFTSNKCEKCPSNIRCWDSNPRPSEHESSHITTRPGLPPNHLSPFPNS